MVLPGPCNFASWPSFEQNGWLHDPRCAVWSKYPWFNTQWTGSWQFHYKGVDTILWTCCSLTDRDRQSINHQLSDICCGVNLCWNWVGHSSSDFQYIEGKICTKNITHTPQVLAAHLKPQLHTKIWPAHPKPKLHTCVLNVAVLAKPCWLGSCDCENFSVVYSSIDLINTNCLSPLIMCFNTVVCDMSHHGHVQVCQFRFLMQVKIDNEISSGGLSCLERPTRSSRGRYW